MPQFNQCIRHNSPSRRKEGENSGLCEVDIPVSVRLQSEDGPTGEWGGGWPSADCFPASSNVSWTPYQGLFCNLQLKKAV